MRLALAPFVGGTLVFVGTLIISSFVSSPPTRAEFDSLEAVTNERYRSIDNRLQKLHNGQVRIETYLLGSKK